MINAIPRTRAVPLRAPIYRTQVATQQRRHGLIGPLAGPILAAAVGIGFNVLVVMTLIL